MKILIIRWTINNPMWLFVAKLLLNAKNVINGHSLYVQYDILCSCNQCFWVNVPFFTFMWLLATISHIAPRQRCCWPICFTQTHPFSTNQLTALGFYMQIPILIIMEYVTEIHGKRRSMNLVLISHKYSQRNTNLGITFCHRCENLFSLQPED